MNAKQRRKTFKLMGEILLDIKAINSLQLEEALINQKKRDKHVYLGQILTDLGYAREDDILRGLKTQYTFPFIPLEHYSIHPEVLRFIPYETAKNYCVMPIDKMGNTLTVAFADPLNSEAIKHIEDFSECKVRVVLTGQSAIRSAIAVHYKREQGKGIKSAPDSESGQGVTRYGTIADEEPEKMQRRKHERVDVDLKAIAIFRDNIKRPLRIINISVAGSTIMTDMSVSQGERLELLPVNYNFFANFLKSDSFSLRMTTTERLWEQIAVLLSVFFDNLPKKEAWVVWSKKETEGVFKAGIRFSVHSAIDQEQAKKLVPSGHFSYQI